MTAHKSYNIQILIVIVIQDPISYTKHLSFWWNIDSSAYNMIFDKHSKDCQRLIMHIYNKYKSIQDLIYYITW
jgi:hypothetical protein